MCRIIYHAMIVPFSTSFVDIVKSLEAEMSCQGRKVK